MATHWALESRPSWIQVSIVLTVYSLSSFRRGHDSDFVNFLRNSLTVYSLGSFLGGQASRLGDELRL